MKKSTNILNKMSLLPRYNWDYTLSDYCRSLPSAFNKPAATENTLEEIFGRRPVLTTSGRVSQYLILKSLNLPEGSSVGVPLFVCPIVFEAVQKAGLVPTFLDIDIDDYTISIKDLEKKKDSLSAIVAVHMFGHPADMDEIFAVCSNMPVIEDCAQALFSTYKGDYLGLKSAASFFSFRSGKYVSAGEGSAIFSQDPALYEAIKRSAGALREWNTFEELVHCTSVLVKSKLYHRPWYGLLGKPVGTILDRKLNLTAKTGLKLYNISRSDRRTINGKIKSLAMKIGRQRQNSLYYLNNITLKNVSLPREKTDCVSNYFQFAIRLPSQEMRDSLAEYLFEHGIDSAKYLDDVVDIARKNYGYTGDCPNAELCSKTVLVIPNHYTLKQSDLKKMISVINGFSGLV
jgi:dTDP-4-amino-4,6-dideoxygalactose transaminase